MAFLAGNARVEADEGEARDVVIEVDLLAPTGLFVALLALGAELPLVGIGLGVAARTGNGQLVAIEVAGVASFALCFGVQSAQGKFRCLVVI